MRRLQHRTAVVTGAASGIGQATALALAQQGCRLALVDIDAPGLDDTARQVRDCGQPASTHMVDVSDRQAMLALPDEVLAEHDGVHIVVNNAGVTCTAGFHEHELDDFEWVLGVNLWGVIYGCKAFMPLLLANDESHIVNISSMFGIVGVPGQSSYCTSKFAVRGFSESLWEELAGTPVGLTVVHPGGVATNIVANARGNDAESRARTQRFFLENALPPEKVAERIVGAIRRGRRRLLVTPEAHLSDLARRLLPVAGNRLVTRLIVRMLGMRQQVEDSRRAAIAQAREEARQAGRN